MCDCVSSLVMDWARSESKLWKSSPSLAQAYLVHFQKSEPWRASDFYYVQWCSYQKLQEAIFMLNTVKQSKNKWVCTKPRLGLGSDPTLLELLLLGRAGGVRNSSFHTLMGTALFKIGSDDNWGMTQAPQLIRTKISRTKRDNCEGQSGHWKSRLWTRSLKYTISIEWNVQ